jgi:peptide/nickel transport system substrate-binding protein
MRIPTAIAAMCFAFVAATAGHAQTNVPRSRTLIIAQNFDPQSLWPNFGTSSDNVNAGSIITQPLFWANPRSKKVEPLLAESYQQESPTSFKISLRKNVSFTNGEKMDADAVISAITVIRDPKLAPAYANVARYIAGTEKVDDNTVRITTTNAYPAFELLLTQLYITPPKYWASVGRDGFGQKPIGTGPYQLTQWQKDNQLILDKNPNYWGQAPEGVDRVVLRPVPDDTARAAGLQSGEFDITSALSLADVPQLESDPAVQIIGVPSFRIFSISLSSLDRHPSPIQNKMVRQALNYAIDKQSIIKNVLFNRARPLSGQFLRDDQIGFDPSIKDYPYDPEKAKKMLADAGFPNGFEVTFKFPTGRYAQDREVSEAVAGMLQKVGVKSNMISLEPGEFLRQMVNRELAPIAFVGYAPGDDPDLQVSQYRSDWRYSYVQNKQIDELIDAGARELDPQKRKDIYQRLSKLMWDEAPAIFLYQGMDFYGTSTRVKNFMPTGDQKLPLYGIKLEQ